MFRLTSSFKGLAKALYNNLTGGSSFCHKALVCDLTALQTKHRHLIYYQCLNISARVDYSVCSLGKHIRDWQVSNVEIGQSRTNVHIENTISRNVRKMIFIETYIKG